MGGGGENGGSDGVEGGYGGEAMYGGGWGEGREGRR